ncbi:hypothetical protein EVAR_14273_1 [Eumeta japonica]|uniref:Uncharacterized protein n=1 Tax=Eumeta variegata TaxID=151549 RepID=A0A4C1W9N2_EUMVA|nr:hypothetical protein EVAR_14273_1 [Eumeta japonica]
MIKLNRYDQSPGSMSDYFSNQCKTFMLVNPDASLTESLATPGHRARCAPPRNVVVNVNEYADPLEGRQSPPTMDIRSYRGVTSAVLVSREGIGDLKEGRVGQ